MVGRGAAAAADDLDAGRGQVWEVRGHFLGALRVDGAEGAVEPRHAGVGIGHQLLVEAALLHGGLKLGNAVEGVRHAGVLVAPGLGAAVDPDEVDVVEQVVAPGVLARGEYVQKVGGRVPPIGAIDDLLAFAVPRVFKREVDGHGQAGLADDIADHGRFDRGKLGLNREEIDPAFVECVDDALMRGADLVVGNAKIRTARVGFDGPRGGADGAGDEDIPLAEFPGALGELGPALGQRTGLSRVFAGHGQMQLRGDKGVGANAVGPRGNVVGVNGDDGLGVAFVGEGGVGQLDLASEKLGAKAAIVQERTCVVEALEERGHRAGLHLGQGVGAGAAEQPFEQALAKI